METVRCPYCESEVEINHDDGMYYEEDKLVPIECSDCDKSFMVTTSISRYYEGHEADCLNDSKHDWKPTVSYPKEATRMRCSMCTEERKPTDEERIKYEIPSFKV